MEIVVVGRHTEVDGRFRTQAESKLAKAAQLDPRVQRIDVEVTHEKNPKLADQAERVELTVRAKGPVVRAEAAADDRFAALDLALDKLMERLRRNRDRRKDHRRGVVPPTGAVDYVEDGPLDAVTAAAVADRGADLLVETEADAASVMAEAGAGAQLEVNGGPVLRQLGDSPVIIRQKLHSADRISLEEAVDQMELVGHDFFLFIDAETGRPSAVYKRRGWTYGVLQLDATVS